MSQRVVGYEGRRPKIVDEGPSSAAATDPIAMHANGGMPALGGPTGGAGPVERRQATPEELAAARAREAKVRPLARPPLDAVVDRVDVAATVAAVRLRRENAERMQTSRQRGADAHVAAVAAASPPAGQGPARTSHGIRIPSPAPEEEPAMVTPAQVEEAVAEPGPNIHEIIPGASPDPNDKLVPVVVIGCPSCLHRDVCSIRPKVEDPAIWGLPRFAFELHPAIHPSMELILDCDHFLPEAIAPSGNHWVGPDALGRFTAVDPDAEVEEPSPADPRLAVDALVTDVATPPRATAGWPRLLRDMPAEARASVEPVTPSRRGSQGLTARQQEILDAVIDAGDRRVAADSLNTTIEGVNATLRDIGKKGLLPLEVRPFLPAGILAKFPAPEASA